MIPAYRGKIYRADTENTAVPKCMGLPIITSITKTYDADLADVKTIVFGTDRNYCIDLGVNARYQIFIRRVNPPQDTIDDT